MHLRSGQLHMLAIKKIAYFTDSDMSIEEASDLYLNGYLAAIKAQA